MDLARYTALFLSDSRDHLQRCNALLLEWEREPTSLTPVAELFRSFHSIKGSAATLGFDEVADLAHVAEHLLDMGLKLGGTLRQYVEMLVELGDEIGVADRVVVEHGDVARRLVGDVHLVPLIRKADQRAAHRDHVVVRMG